MRPPAFVVTSLVAMCAATVAIRAQVGKVASDGVYTAAQAERGKSVVQTNCTRCHGDDLTGIEGPALVGGAFMLKWESQNLERLFQKLRETMPAGAPETVSDGEKVDALAFLLQENGFAAGAEELPQDVNSLASIQMRRTGTGRPRDGSIVEAVGCLARESDKEWVLNNSSGPRATSMGTATSGEPAPLGTQVVHLMSVFPDPSSHVGHKMQAKGLLVSNPAGDRINVLTLEDLASSCER